MSSGVRYSETLRMQPSTFAELVGIFVLAAAPLAVVAWLRWRPLGAALVGVVVVAVSAVFWHTRWQFQVRNDGLYYRLVPFLPVWRSIAVASEVTTVTANHESNGRDILDDEAALFPWSTGNRTVVMATNGGVRIELASGGEVYVSSRSPDAFASALRAVVT